MVVAKNQMALNNLAAQFRHRQVHKEYLTIVCGHPNPVEGTIDAPVGRSLHDRKKMSASVHRGRHAVTHYTTIEHYPAHTMLRVRIETGRTHQIRVHMAHRRHPVAGDRQYGGKMAAALPVEVDRQMLHAERLSFFHPRFGEEICFVAPMPEDMRNLIRVLRAAS
jgi:23S rRNA pseudouridine1911/1915/1917 synthase